MSHTVTAPPDAHLLAYTTHCCSTPGSLEALVDDLRGWTVAVHPEMTPCHEPAREWPRVLAFDAQIVVGISEHAGVIALWTKPWSNAGNPEAARQRAAERLADFATVFGTVEPGSIVKVPGGKTILAE